MAPSFSFYKVGITLAILIVFLIGSSANNLSPYHYSQSCPKFYPLVAQHVHNAIMKETRMGASLLRLHFHDCFVNGCDGSVLLDDTNLFTGEKNAAPNVNSLRGFEVIDDIKAEVEATCPGVVSCADILALAAAESVKQLGGPNYLAEMGRLDATTASQADANRSIPTPTLDLNGLVSKFNDVGLDKHDLVVLSGAHSIGQARCTNFRYRIYSNADVIDPRYAQMLQGKCPKNPGIGDDNLAAMDQSPALFDTNYYTLLLRKQGLLHSDQQLLNDPMINWWVNKYNRDQNRFWGDFGAAMIKMGRISGLNQGEIREHCRMPNDYC